MNCRKAEQWLLRSMDGRLDERARGPLAKHLEACPACRKAEREYRIMFGALKAGRDAAPLPRFWERLEPRLREETELVPLLFWERWNLRAFLLFAPRAGELSQSAALLLENRDPLSETTALFNADKPETQTMMLMFASLDRDTTARRPTP